MGGVEIVAAAVSGNNDGATFTAGRVSRPSRQQLDRSPSTSRSTLMNAPAHVLARNYSDASSATNLQVARQATLSRPSTPSTPSLQQLLDTAKLRNRSGTLTSPRPNIGNAQQAHQSEASASKAARRHTLAGASAPTHHILSPLSLRSISSTLNAVRLSRVQVSSTNPSSSHTPTPAAPVPARTHSDSTAQCIFASSYLAGPERASSDRQHIQPHLLPRNNLHISPIVHDSQTPDKPSSAIPIPLPRQLTTDPLVPLTGRFRKGLPPDNDHLVETPRRRLKRQCLLPYYTRGRATPRRIGIASPNASSSSTSPKSSIGDLPTPTGALSPLFLARSRTDDHCANECHRRCPSSPSKQRLRHQRSRRLVSFSPDNTQHRYTSPHMRSSSGASSFAHTPTSPLSSGRARHAITTMQPNRNPNARARKPQEFSLPIPRFHPAMYQSPSNSNANTAASSPRNIRSPGRLQPPMSPRAQQRQLGEARHALMEMHKEILRTTGASGAAAANHKLPEAPSLLPTCSPGEATPLTLEDGPGDYLTAGAVRRGQYTDSASHRDMVERMIRDEEERRQGGGNIPSSAPVSPAAGP